VYTRHLTRGYMVTLTRIVISAGCAVLVVSIMDLFVPFLVAVLFGVAAFMLLYVSLDPNNAQ